MPRTIRIGKNPENDFVINNPSVSRNHATMTVADDNCSALLRDLGSKNGTYVNGIRITQDTPVNLNDQLKFGTENVTLSEIVRKTKVLPWPHDPNTRVIGRGENCHIQMNYVDVSEHHAVLSRSADGTVRIEDSGSRNGTYVNEERIMSKVLKKGDRVTIARKYPLDWESIFPPLPEILPPPKKLWKRIIQYATAVLALIALGVGGYFLFRGQETPVKIDTTDKDTLYTVERINKEYSSAVCMVVVEYGFRVLLDGEDYTKELFSDKVINKTGVQGTAFFISEDGMLATNLHVARPWLWTDQIDRIKNSVKRKQINFEEDYPLLSRAEIKVEPETKMYITLDGLPLSKGNQIEVQEYKGHDETDKDVAILRLKNHKQLPVGVETVIHIPHDEVSYTQGEKIFYRGYPYGSELAENENKDINAQCITGTVSQDLGEFIVGIQAPAYGGASGSPVFNEKGKLIGVLNSGAGESFTRAIKVKHLQDLLK